MTFETDLKSHLQADSSIAALVNDRITPNLGGRSGTTPYIVYQVISDEPQPDLDGADGNMIRYRVQIDIWSATSDQAAQIAELVRIRMKTAASNFRSVPVSRFDDYESDIDRRRVSRDFSIWYRTS